MNLAIFREEQAKTQNENTPLHFAANSGQLGAYQLIMENIVNKNPGDYTGWTPLHSAAQNGHLIVVKPILSSLSAGHVQLTNTETLHLNWLLN